MACQAPCGRGRGRGPGTDDPDPWRGLPTFMTDTLEDASRNRTLVDMFMIRLHHGAVAATRWRG
ncbi:MAG: hypothetical protein WAL22_05200 [Solirubrobacteraceae bacterium]